MNQDGVPQDNQGGQPSGDEGPQSQQIRTQHVTARVPESVSRGVFSTGVIVITGGSEFILDFIQNIGRPHQVAARVVMPHHVLIQFVDALRKNTENYKQRFGDLPEIPRPPAPANRPSVQEIYDDLKLPEELMSGCYANGVMISHTPGEFGFDFITNFFPNSAVSCRVFLSAAQIPRTLETLSSTCQQFQQRVEQQRRQQNQPPDSGDAPPDVVQPPPPEDPPPEGSQ